jgi:hypothetical protein
MQVADNVLTQAMYQVLLRTLAPRDFSKGRTGEREEQREAGEVGREGGAEGVCPREREFVRGVDRGTCLLTYADVSIRMLTYADVCWRMLTYAGVC